MGAAWDEALASDRPVVLEFKTDPEVPPLPPHISLEQAKNFMLHHDQGDPDEGALIKGALRQVLSRHWTGKEHGARGDESSAPASASTDPPGAAGRGPGRPRVIGAAAGAPDWRWFQLSATPQRYAQGRAGPGPRSLHAAAACFGLASWPTAPSSITGPISRTLGCCPPLAACRRW